jgi:hypothetical protein
VQLLHENGMTGSDEEQRSLGFDSEKEDDAGRDQPLEELEVRVFLLLPRVRRKDIYMK